MLLQPLAGMAFGIRLGPKSQFGTKLIENAGGILVAFRCRKTEPDVSLYEILRYTLAVDVVNGRLTRLSYFTKHYQARLPPLCLCGHRVDCQFFLGESMKPVITVGAQ